MGLGPDTSKYNKNLQKYQDSKKKKKSWFEKATDVINPTKPHSGGRKAAKDFGKLVPKKKDGGIIKNPCDFGKIKKLMKKKK